MVETSSSNTEGVGSIPGWGAKLLHASWLTNQNMNNRNNTVTNSIEILKWSTLKNPLKNKIRHVSWVPRLLVLSSVGTPLLTQHGEGQQALAESCNFTGLKHRKVRAWGRLIVGIWGQNHKEEISSEWESPQILNPLWIPLKPLVHF